MLEARGSLITVFSHCETPISRRVASKSHIALCLCEVLPTLERVSHPVKRRSVSASAATTEHKITRVGLAVPSTLAIPVVESAHGRSRPMRAHVAEALATRTSTGEPKTHPADAIARPAETAAMAEAPALRAGPASM
ncbi:MAG: hypothetical protein K8R23_03290, partial [Chthoniobacter sp.]|nr:hypothetical protein [Chthoniobacter sp.]